jgi:hypothetical protein
MREFLAIIIWFACGLFITAGLAAALEYRQLANNKVDQNADVWPGISAVNSSGFAVGNNSGKPLQLEFHPGVLPNAI